MPEQTTTVNKDGSITIIATMVPSDAPPGDVSLGLQLIGDQVEQSPVKEMIPHGQSWRN